MQGTIAVQLKEHDPLVNVKIDKKIDKVIIELSKKRKLNFFYFLLL